jgi:hypothetical protein
MASYQIVVLNTITDTSGNFTVSGVFCLTAPANAPVPIPGYVSLNPYIDEPTLLKLQDGTLVEQAFTSSTFAQGTSLATVQASIQSQYTAAQTALTNTNPALSGLVGTQYNGSSWASETLPNSFITSPTIIDFETAVLLGRIPGAISGRAIGYVSTSDQNNHAVRSTLYTPQGVNAQRSIVSTNANDSAAGTGARTVLLTYLNTSFQLKSETITLNGTTPVNTVGTDIAYVESIQVTSVGSGAVNAGTLNFMTQTGGAGTVWASAAPGDNGTAYAHHYVPTGFTCYVLNFGGGGTGTSGVLNLIHQQNLATPNAPFAQIGLPIVHPVNAQWDHEFQIPLAVPGPDLIYLNELPTTSTANKTWGGFEYVQF